MVGLQHQARARRMGGLDPPPFGLGMGTPEQERHRLRLLGHRLDQGIGQRFPAPAGVHGGLSWLHGQATVEQENALPRPGSREPLMGSGCPVLACHSSSTLRNDGGQATPAGTEKASPSA